jgi:hypothetical protein
VALITLWLSSNNFRPSSVKRAIRLEMHSWWQRMSGMERAHISLPANSAASSVSWLVRASCSRLICSKVSTSC